MTKLTKQQKRNYIARYRNAKDTIFTAYKKPSQTKINTYIYICETAEQMGGTNPKVIGHNCNTYATAFTFYRNGWEIIRIDTKDNIYMFYTNPLRLYAEYKGN